MPRATRTSTTGAREATRVPRLPFSRSGDAEARSFWSPRPTGDYLADCSLGRRYGEALLPLIRREMGVQLLRFVVLDMVRDGDAERDRGLIVGMMGVVGQAVRGAA